MTSRRVARDALVKPWLCPAIVIPVLAWGHVCNSASLVQQATQGVKVNPDALVIQDFEERVAQYVKLRKALESKLPPLKPTVSSEPIERRQHLLAHRLREAREHARQGEFFTPAIRAEFVRLIGMSMSGTEAHRIRESLNHAEPVRVRIRVNSPYPEKIPLQSMPPSLLLNLPPLPAELDYRLVGRDLLLRDVGANLVIDYIPEALP